MRILVIGGCGNFGKRLAANLVDYSDHKIILGGRSQVSLAKAKHLYAVSRKSVEVIQLDIHDKAFESQLLSVAPDIVVNAVGPYQFQVSGNSYVVAHACLRADCHYIDFADDRQFVRQFKKAFDAKAKQADLIFISGASSVPALTTAVLDRYQQEFKFIETLNYGISPGNQTERGSGTVASILSYTGKPFKALWAGEWQTRFGWQDLSRYDFGAPIGKRWLSNCDIPDLDILPDLFPQLKSVRFQAGLEISLLHLGLWFLSWLVRARLIKNWSVYTNPLVVISRWFEKFGSDNGGMFIELSGVDKKRELIKRTWQLIAENGSGPNIPVIPSEIVIRKISQNQLKPGAKACVSLFSIAEFFEIAQRWDIYQREVAND